MDLYTTLIEEARKGGFPLAGAVDIELALNDPKVIFNSHLEKYDQWIDAGYVGKMEYLRRGRDRRSDPRLVFPEAKSILCVALPYPNPKQNPNTAAEGPRYARYLQGKDYHIEISEMLEKAMQNVQAKWDQSLKWKVCVDTSALLERTWAYLCGLGWIGKNTLLIHPKFGSYLLLGEVLINQELGQKPHPLPNYCGNCERCLTSCPTQAFTRAGQLNSNRCISYWTLEKRGALEISPSDQSKIQTWIAGCDICQEACPFNRKSLQPAAEFSAADRWVDLLLETPDEYKIRVKYSALNRVKPTQFSRNLAINLFNFLSQTHENSLKADLLPLIEFRLNQESDAIAKIEWQKCLDLIRDTRHASI